MNDTTTLNDPAVIYLPHDGVSDRQRSGLTSDRSYANPSEYHIWYDEEAEQCLQRRESRCTQPQPDLTSTPKQQISGAQSLGYLGRKKQTTTLQVMSDLEEVGGSER
jgi:hypothetical protein